MVTSLNWLRKVVPGTLKPLVFLVHPSKVEEKVLQLLADEVGHFLHQSDGQMEILDFAAAAQSPHSRLRRIRGVGRLDLSRMVQRFLPSELVVQSTHPTSRARRFAGPKVGFKARPSRKRTPTELWPSDSDWGETAVELVNRNICEVIDFDDIAEVRATSVHFGVQQQMQRSSTKCGCLRQNHLMSQLHLLDGKRLLCRCSLGSTCHVCVHLSCWRLHRQCALSRTRSMWQVYVDNLDVIEVCGWSDVSELIASGNHEGIENITRTTKCLDPWAKKW